MVDVVPPLRSEPLFDELGNITIRYAEYFERSAESTTTNEDNIDLFSSLNPANAAVAGLTKKIKDLELLLELSISNRLSGFERELRITKITADYTTIGNEVVICNNTTPITVTLRGSPNNKERVTIVRKDAPVKMISTAGINGRTTAIPLISVGDAPDLLFTTDAAEYSIV